MNTTTAARQKLRREGAIAKAFRWVVAFAAIFPALRFFGHGIGFVLLVAFVQLAIYELIATIIIWTCKLLAYGMRRDDG